MIGSLVSLSAAVIAPLVVLHCRSVVSAAASKVECQPKGAARPRNKRVQNVTLALRVRGCSVVTGEKAPVDASASNGAGSTFQNVHGIFLARFSKGPRRNPIAKPAFIALLRERTTQSPHRGAPKGVTTLLRSEPSSPPFDAPPSRQARRSRRRVPPPRFHALGDTFDCQRSSGLAPCRSYRLAAPVPFARSLIDGVNPCIGSARLAVEKKSRLPARRADRPSGLVSALSRVAGIAGGPKPPRGYRASEERGAIVPPK